MSCSKWNWTEICDHRPCCGDCDLCDYPDPDDGDDLDVISTRNTDKIQYSPYLVGINAENEA